MISNWTQVSHLLGALFALPCLIVVILIYILTFSVLRMPPKTKHSLINIWTLIALLMAIFSFGVHFRHHQMICVIMAFSIHFTTISCLLWMLSSAISMYKILNARSNERIFRCEDGESSPNRRSVQNGHKSKTCGTVCGQYLFGYGVGLMACISSLSMSINNKDLMVVANREFCILPISSGLPFLYTPIAVLIAVNLLIYLIIICLLGGLGADFVSLAGDSANFPKDLSYVIKSTPRKGDLEWPYKTQFFSHISLCLLFICQWCCMICLAVWRPLSVVDLLSVSDQLFYGLLYSFSVFFTAFFVVIFYLCKRPDVRTGLKRWITCKMRYRAVPDVSIIPKVDVIRSDVTSNQSLIDHKLDHSDLQVVSTKANNTNHGIVYEEISERMMPYRLLSHRNGNQSICNGYAPTASMLESGLSPEVFIDPRLNIIAKRFFEKNRRKNDLTKSVKNNLNIQDSCKFSSTGLDIDAISCLARIAPPNKINNDLSYSKAKSDIACWSSSKSPTGRLGDRRKMKRLNLVTQESQATKDGELGKRSSKTSSKTSSKKPASIVLPTSPSSGPKWVLKPSSSIPVGLEEKDKETRSVCCGSEVLSTVSQPWMCSSKSYQQQLPTCRHHKSHHRRHPRGWHRCDRYPVPYSCDTCECCSTSRTIIAPNHDEIKTLSTVENESKTKGLSNGKRKRRRRRRSNCKVNMNENGLVASHHPCGHHLPRSPSVSGYRNAPSCHHCYSLHCSSSDTQ